jgi:hypothetical protein
MQQQPQYAPSPPINTLAIVSLVSAILGWSLVPFIGSVVAVITGHMARREISNSLGAQGGDGLAIAGLIIGYVNLVMYCISSVIFVLIFGGMIGLGGCAIWADSVGFNPSNVIPPLPSG